MYIWTKQSVKRAKAGGPATSGANTRKITSNWLRAGALSRSKRFPLLALLVLSLAGTFPARAQYVTVSECASWAAADYAAKIAAGWNPDSSEWLMDIYPDTPLGELVVMFGDPSQPGGRGSNLLVGACYLDVPTGTQSAPNPPQTPAVGCGSIIHNDNQALGERVPVVGASFDLAYFSDRVPGRVQAYTIQTFAAGSWISYLGRFSETGSGGTFVWDGFDSSMNPVQGSIAAFVGYGDRGCPAGGTVIFACVGAICPPVATCNAPFFVPLVSVTVGTYRADLLGLGGWSPSILHYYHTNTKILYFGDGSNRSVTASPYANGTQWIVGNNDGSELYVFDLRGKHLYTLNGLTGSMLYTFAYDSSNHPSIITDAYSNVTTVLRDGSGVLTGIQSPYGQVTTFTLDANGYLATITNPNHETYAMTYFGAGGLLSTFQKPRGQVSTFAYDSSGLLTLDSNSAGNSTALSSIAGSPGNSTVQSTSAMNLVTSFTIASQPNAVPSKYSRLTTYPDSTTETYYSTTSVGPSPGNTYEFYSDTSPSNLYQLTYVPDARHVGFREPAEVTHRDVHVLGAKQGSCREDRQQQIRSHRASSGCPSLLGYPFLP